MNISISIKESLLLLGTLEKIKSKQIPIKVGYKIARLIPALEDERKVYYETLKALIETYGVRDENDNLQFSEDGDSIAIIPELKEQCLNEIKELENTIIELNLPQFNIDDFGDIDLSIQEVINLSPIISE